MNNAQRKAKAARERMDAVLVIRQHRRGGVNTLPLRYLVDDERREFLARAVSPL